jgi:hypothetical protein
MPSRTSALAVFSGSTGGLCRRSSSTRAGFRRYERQLVRVTNPSRGRRLQPENRRGDAWHISHAPPLLFHRAAFPTRRCAGDCEGSPILAPRRKRKERRGRGHDLRGPRWDQGSTGGKHLFPPPDATSPRSPQRHARKGAASVVPRLAPWAPTGAKGPHVLGRGQP